MKAHIVPEDKIKEDYSLCSKSGIADRADRLYWEGYKHCLDEITDNFPSTEIPKLECKCNEPVKCSNCDEMVVLVSSGEFCPKCFC